MNFSGTKIRWICRNFVIWAQFYLFAETIYSILLLENKRKDDKVLLLKSQYCFQVENISQKSPLLIFHNISADNVNCVGNVNGVVITWAVPFIGKH